MKYFKNRVIFYVFSMATIVTPLVSNAGDDVGVFAVPMSIDKQMVFSNFYLEVPYIEYRQEINEFEKQAKKPAEKSFAHLFFAVNEENSSLALPYINKENELVKQMGLAKFMEAFHKSLSKLKNPMVEGAIPGNRYVRFVLFESDHDHNPFRIFTFQQVDVSGKFLYTSGALGSVDGLVNRIYRIASEKKNLSTVRLKRSEIKDLQALRKLEFDSRELLSGKSNNTIALYLKGQAYYFDLTSPDDSILKSSILASYSKTFDLLRQGNIDEYLMQFTPVSRNILKQSLAKMSEKDIEDYVKNDVGQRYIRFVIDANPVAIIFYSKVEMTSLKDERIYHDYMIRGSEGVYRIANVNREGPLDELLEDKMFVDEGLLPLINNVKEDIERNNRKGT